MKKLTKLFAILLTFCLIIGVIAICASAEEKSQFDASQYGDKITNYTYSTYESASVTGFAVGGGCDSIMDRSVSSISGSTNKFVRITTKETPPTAAPSSNGFFYTWANATDKLVLTEGYDYATLDFDIAITGEGAYFNGAYFAIFPVSPASYPFPLYTIQHEGEWYISTVGTYDASKPAIKISSEIGVWNHITFAWDLTKSTKSSTMYAYVNGEYLSAATIALGATTEFERLSILFPKGVVLDNYSADFGIDNITSNLYNDGYTSPNVYGIDDLFANAPKGKSISMCGDVVYQENYELNDPFVEKQIAATVDGVNYASAPAASANVVYGSNIVVQNNSFCYLGNNAERFTATVYNGASFSTAKNAGEFTVKTLETTAEYTVYEYTRNIDYVGDGYNTLYTHDYQDGTEGTKETYLKYDGNFQSAVVTDGDNKYVEITNKNTTTTLAANALYRIPLVASTSSTTTELLGDYDYTVLDFDFKTNTNFYNNMWFGLHKGVVNNWVELMRIKDKDGKMMINDKIDLSEKVDEWIHVTVIVVPGKATYVYIDGEYYNTASAIAATDRVARLEIFFNKDTTVHDFSLGIDNVQLRRFDKGYNSGASVFGIDDYMNFGDKTLPIYQVEDMIYSEGYTYLGDSANKPVAKNGDEEYYIPSSAFLFANDGDTITLNKDVTIVKDLPASVKSLNIVGGNVTLHNDVARIFTFADGKLTRNLLYNVEIYEGEKLLETTAFKVGSLIDTTTFNFVTTAKGDCKVAAAWLFEKDGERLPLSEFTGANEGETVKLFANTASITWNDTYGEPIATEDWLVGSVASHGFDELDSYDPENNGWYELAYFWNAKDADLTVTGDASHNPVKAPVEAFTGLMYNYTFDYTFKPSYYVPVPDEDLGVVVSEGWYANGINVDKGEPGKKYYDDMTSDIVNFAALKIIEANNIVQVGSDSYYKFDGSYISAFAWYGVNAFEVFYDVTYEGNVYKLSSKVAVSRLGLKTTESISVPSYINNALAGSECGSETVVLIMNWVKYVSESYAAQGEYKEQTEILKILEKHADCGCIYDLTDALPTEAPEYNVEGLTGLSAAYMVNASGARFAIYVPVDLYTANAETFGITATIRGLDVSASKIRNITYGFYIMTEVDTDKSTETETVYKESVTTVNGVKCYVFLMDNSFSIYNANAEYAINVKVNDEVSMSGTYSLAAYIYNTNVKLGLYTYDAENGWAIDETKPMSGAESINYRLLRVAMAYANFAKAAYEYKVD